jgi:hypothetical protein
MSVDPTLLPDTTRPHAQNGQSCQDCKDIRGPVRRQGTECGKVLTPLGVTGRAGTWKGCASVVTNSCGIATGSHQSHYSVNEGEGYAQL